MEDIDYTEKIATFNLLVGNTNEEIALNYLTITNWDEHKVAILYNQEHKSSQSKHQPSVKIPPSYHNTSSKTKNNKNNSNYNYNYNYNPLYYYSNSNSY